MKFIVHLNQKIFIMKYLIILIVLATGTSLEAQNFRGIDKSPLDMVNYPSSSRVQDKMVRVLYSRPKLNGRDLSTLAPKDKVWRTGANESTEITFFKAATIAGKTVPAGRYTLYTIPGGNTWTVILNKALNTWGAYSYDEKQDLIRVDVPVSKADEALEAFSMSIDGGGTAAQLHMGWGTLRVSVPMTF